MVIETLTAILVIITGIYAYLTHKIAKATEKNVEAQLRSLHASSFAKVYDILDDEAVVAARYVVNNLGTTPYEQWKADKRWGEIEKSIKTLLRAYNIAGILVKHGFLSEEHIVPDWEPSLRSTWSTLRPYVAEQRVLRGSENHWADYEWLARRAELYAAGAAGPAAVARGSGRDARPEPAAAPDRRCTTCGCSAPAGEPRGR